PRLLDRHDRQRRAHAGPRDDVVLAPAVLEEPNLDAARAPAGPLVLEPESAKVEAEPAEGFRVAREQAAQGEVVGRVEDAGQREGVLRGGAARGDGEVLLGRDESG